MNSSRRRLNLEARLLVGRGESAQLGAYNLLSLGLSFTTNGAFDFATDQRSFQSLTAIDRPGELWPERLVHTKRNRPSRIRQQPQFSIKASLQIHSPPINFSWNLNLGEVFRVRSKSCAGGKHFLIPFKLSNNSPARTLAGLLMADAHCWLVKRVHGRILQRAT